MRELFACCFVAACVVSVAAAQQTNPVDRAVTNPITDTPNVNPLQQDPRIITQPSPQPTSPLTSPTEVAPEEQPTDALEAISDTLEVSGTEDARVVVREGNVDARIGIYRLQADKITIYEATNTAILEGNIIIDQGNQRIAGSRATFNYRTKTGSFENATGYTDQTEDGTTLYFTADRVERVSPRKIIIINGEVTACDEDVPKWSFRTKRAEIDLKDRVRLSRPSFRVKDVPILVLPYASISLKPRDRQSGFLTPTFSGSGEKGFRFSQAYYQTLGRSADITLRGDVYTSRGLGLGADVRTRSNSRSFLNFGFFAVKDRLFGDSVSAENPDQGGSSFYVEGAQYFSNGFLAAADVNITSSLEFRQVFSDGIQLAISPEERSQVFVNRNFKDYSFNLLARTNVTSLENSRIRIRQLPSISLEKRPSLFNLFGISEKLPTYFSFGASLEGMSRKETIEDFALAQLNGTPNALITPSIVQRLDLHPRFAVPFNVGGWTLTAVAGARATYYSNSVDPLTRLVIPRDLTRGYGEFEFDVRPPALARRFRRNDGSFRFLHTIEPYAVYRRIYGINRFERVIRFDEVDAIADTNEIEFGVMNRFFTRLATQRVGGVREDLTIGANSANGITAPQTDSQPVANAQPYELVSITLRAKYFFDPTFGGALIPGRRNQFYPLNTFSGFTYGGVPRRLSPVNINVRVRPRSQFFADFRADVDVRERGGLRNLALSAGLDRRLIKAFQTFYFTRAVNLAPSLAQFANANGNEPGTLQGSQWSPSVYLGNTDRPGFFGGVSLFFDFQNRADRGGSSLISSTTTVGYSFDCCAIAVQNYSFDVGLRQENRVAFSFRLNGIGTFGTEQIGQRFR